MTLQETGSVRAKAAESNGGTAGSLRFTLGELSGSLGDLGTFLPLTVAMAVTCGLDLGVILVLAGAMNVASGVWFRQPIAVQPMKAIAVVAIAEGLLPGEIAAAGLATGAAVMALGIFGAVGWASRHVPKAVVRGIQLGVGAKLAFKGIEWLTGFGMGLDGFRTGTALPFLGHDSLAVAAVVAALLLLPHLRRGPVLFLVFLGGFVLLFLGDSAAYEGLSLGLPGFALTLPAASEWGGGIVKGAIPQLPLTLLNSVIAVCALSADYFPGRGILPRRMAVSVGAMNLLCVPFGGMPMCHGAGGLAGQYRFGARTGGSVILLGSGKILAGLLFGAALVSLLGAYPRSILAVMLGLAGWSLAAVARDSLRGTSLAVVLATAIPILLVNTVAGFGIGLAVWIALSAARGRKDPS